MRLWFIFKPRGPDLEPWWGKLFLREPHVFVVLAMGEGQVVILNPRRHRLEVQALVAWPWQVLQQAFDSGYSAVFYEAEETWAVPAWRPMWTCATFCAYAANIRRWFVRPSSLRRWLLENGGVEVTWVKR